MKKKILNFTNRALIKFGFRLVSISEENNSLFYLHDYGEDGYKKYRETQILFNKKKLDKVWADDKTISLIVNYLLDHKLVDSESQKDKISGLCHGARNGYEVSQFMKLLESDEVFGTDISETALEFPNMVQWDFHEFNPLWENNFDFIYTNSLDQAINPEQAISTWSNQIRDDGLIFIEHTVYHSPKFAGEMDPFGAHPMIMPYLFFEWGQNNYKLKDIIHSTKDHSDTSTLVNVWIFILEKSK